MKPSRAVVLLAVAVGMGESLVGCVPMEPVDNISIRTHEGVLEFAVCERYSGDQIRVSAVSMGDNRETVLWDTRGHVSSDGESVFRYGVDPVGLVTRSGPSDVKLGGNYLDFALNKLDRTGQPTVGLFAQVKGSDITARWRSSTGRYSDKPCE